MGAEHMFIFYPYRKKTTFIFALYILSKKNMRKRIDFHMNIIKDYCIYFVCVSVSPLQVSDKKNPHAHPVHGGFGFWLWLKSNWLVIPV